jgi:hypothetical protein
MILVIVVLLAQCDGVYTDCMADLWRREDACRAPCKACSEELSAEHRVLWPKCWHAERMCEWRQLTECLTGPVPEIRCQLYVTYAIPVLGECVPEMPPACREFDWDRNGTVDLRDAAKELWSM